MSVIEGEVGVPVSSLLEQLEAVVGRLQTADLDGRSAEEELLGVRQLEVVRRKLDHATGRMTGHLDQSGAFSLDGHRNSKAAASGSPRPTRTAPAKPQSRPTNDATSPFWRTTSCGGHNRIKERGFTPVRDPDGTWTIHRPDNGGPITPSA